MKKFKFGLLEKTNFYLGYIFYKIILFKDTRIGIQSLYVAEGIWLLNQVFKLNINFPIKFRRSYYETKHGKFYIHPDLLSTIAISPAFEREDINYLLNCLKRSAKTGKKILFLDIGAYVGLYSVLVGNELRKYKNIDIIAIEPGTEYLSLPTLELLKKNIATNNLRKIVIRNIGLGSSRGINHENIKTDTLEGILGKKLYGVYDEVFIKIDIDDFVVDGLRGAIGFINKVKRTHLFVEDFIKRKEVIAFLEKNRFAFDRKLTEYNSFWIK